MAELAVHTIGLDIGGTKILGVVTDGSGTIIDEERDESPEGFADILDSSAEMIATLREVAPRSKRRRSVSGSRASSTATAC